MSQTVPTSQAGQAGEPTPLGPLPPGVVLAQATPVMYHAVARRLVSPLNPDLDDAAARLLASAPQHGIDFQYAFATHDAHLRASPPDADRPFAVRQACLPVPGAGRTAMLFVSEPPRGGDAGGAEGAAIERAWTINAACAHIAARLGDRVAIAQSLPDPEETWSVRALARAGFQDVGTLKYLRRQPRREDRTPVPEPTMPHGAELVCVATLNERERTARLLEAMDASYTDTLDCPELCGLRDTADILASHRATGVFDPALWWLVMQEGSAHGCVLMSMCPEQRTTELVYLGLGPRLRGHRLGRVLLTYAIHRCAAREASWTVSCAVDERNTPALRVYDALGFRAFARRRAMVKPLKT